MPVPTILVPLDGSPRAEHAIPVAVGLARAVDARLDLLRVAPQRSIVQEMEGRPFTDSGLPGMERRYLDALAARLMEQVPVSVKVARGDPATRIVERAASVNARAIVMATHARGGAGRVLLGSVADAVVHSAAVPVVLIKAPPIEATIPSARRIARVLVPVDGSPQSEQIVPLLVQQLGLRGAEYTVLRVVHPEAALVPAAANGVGTRTQDAEGEIERLAERIRLAGGTAVGKVVIDREPAAVILSEAAQQGARLIAMTTRARRGVSRAVLGSVAGEVVRGTPCPVLVFRPFT